MELLEQNLKTREAAANSAEMKTAMSLESEKASFLQTIREKDKILEQLQKEVEWLEQVLLSRIVAERTDC